MKKKILVFIFITLASVVLFSESFNKDTNYDNILSTVREKGTARVIVKINVQNLFELTKLSTKFRTGNLKNINRYAMYDADQNLSMSIQNSAEAIIYNLNNSFYELKYVFKTIPYISMIVNEASLIKLQNDSMVLNIIEDKPLPLPRYEENHGTEELSKPMLSKSIDLIGADVAWSYGLTGKGWYVAVLDTGIRKTHDMFKGKNIIEQCYSAIGNCPNGQKQMSGKGSSVHYDKKYTGYDHGTHVSGIAAGNDNDYYYGVAKDAGIIAIQVFSKFDKSSSCRNKGNCVLSYQVDQLQGLEYVYSLRGDYNIASANMSLGGGSYKYFCDGNGLKSIIDNLKSVGIATVIATGNNGYCSSISSPACISSAIAVGGTDKFGKEYNNSNWNNGMVDLHAPGVSINSATGKGDSTYSSWNGTSMAAPHVAGTWAIFRQFDRSFSVDKILKILREKRSEITARCSGKKLKMQIDIEKTLVDLIKLFPPINLEIAQVSNMSLLQNEYINILSWAKNPLNNKKNIVSYKIYLSEDSKLTHLSTLSSNVFTYNNRNVQKRTKKTYVITSVNDKGEESVKYYKTINF